jgi:hypothetical protein
LIYTRPGLAGRKFVKNACVQNWRDRHCLHGVSIRRLLPGMVEWLLADPGGWSGSSGDLCEPAAIQLLRGRNRLIPRRTWHGPGPQLSQATTTGRLSRSGRRHSHGPSTQPRARFLAVSAYRHRDRVCHQPPLAPTEHTDFVAAGISARSVVGAAFKQRRAHDVMDEDWSVSPVRRAKEV